MSTKIAITGASGFLGMALIKRLLANGSEVAALSRKDPRITGVDWHAYDLAEPSPALPENIGVIVHAAFSLSGHGAMLEKLNISAAQRLIQLAHERKIPFIFISSMSAHQRAASSYGRAKWSIEHLLDLQTDTIVRPGLIVGDGGVFARMRSSVHRAPLLPLFYGGRQPVHLIALADIITGLETIIVQHRIGTFNLGQPQPITIRELYKHMLAAAQLSRPFLPLPGDLTVKLLHLTESLGLTLPLTAENLLGQKHLQSFETTPSLEKLGLALTPLNQLPWTSHQP